jgi:hypothetical protein
MESCGPAGVDQRVRKASAPSDVGVGIDLLAYAGKSIGKATQLAGPCCRIGRCFNNAYRISGIPNPAGINQNAI